MKLSLVVKQCDSGHMHHLGLKLFVNQKALTFTRFNMMFRLGKIVEQPNI